MIFEDGSQPFCPWAGTLGRRYFENFLEINEKRAAQKKPFFSESPGLPQHHIAEAYQTIRSASFPLEPSDPRYSDGSGVYDDVQQFIVGGNHDLFSLRFGISRSFGGMSQFAIRPMTILPPKS